MAVPKKRTSKSKRNMRRSHDRELARHSILCPACGEPKQLHRVCLSCGQYRGRQVLDVANED